MTGTLVLPKAPPVVRATAPARVVRRWAAVALIVLGAVLVVAPAATGMFGKVAAGQQVLDRFAPHLQPDALARYHGDLRTLRQGEQAVAGVYADQKVPAGRFPGLEAWQQRASAVNGDASHVLDTVEAARGDYQQVAAIDGFDRIPFLVVVAGLVLAYAGVTLLLGRRRQVAVTALLALLASAALIAYPFVSGLASHARAGDRLLGSLKPVVTDTQVVRLQRDFVVVVQAVGEIDTGFRDVPMPASSAHALQTLVKAWPAVSSDLASLTGDLNDSIADVHAMRSLNDLTGPVPGFVVLPWALVGLGGLGAALTLAAVVPVRPTTPREESR